MELAIQLNDVDSELLKRQALANNISISDFVRQTALKAARNAEYLAMLDESDRQLREGKVVVKTMAELEAMAVE